MDSTDRKIVNLLADNGDITAAEIGLRIGLSVPAINKRIAKLKQNKEILKTTIICDSEAVGKPVAAFIMIEIGSFDKNERFLEMVASDRDILECYAVTGDYDYILKICASDIKAFENKVLDFKNAGIVKSHTVMCLREYKFEATPAADENL